MDLNAPLGKGPPPREAPEGRPSRRGRAAAIVAALAAVVGLAVVGIFLVTADPRGGEPYGVASIAPAAPRPVRRASLANVPDPTPTGSLPPSPRITDLAASPASPQPAGGPLVIDVAKVLAERRGQGGATSTLIAPVARGTPPAEPEARAKVAILVAGMGLNPSATRTATEIMPPAVTFAFVPYGETIAAAVATAKAKGHEIVLQMPMQDAGAPPPGPHALHAGESAPEVVADVAWALGRFSGYSGVSNFLGAPVTSDKPVMDAFLRAIAARNLFYVDDGTSHRSLGPILAQQDGIGAARADLVLDATSDPAAVRANLEALAAIAKRKGTAIGLASGLPDHLAAIAAFAAGLRGRDIALVPVGALAARIPSVAAAR